MTRLSAVYILLSLVLTTGTAQATNSTDKLFIAEYKGKYSGMTIKSTRTLERENSGRYLFKSEIKSFLGNITEESYFNLTPEKQIKPDLYKYQRKILGQTSNQQMVFDWEKSTAHFTRKEKPEKNADHKITPGILDLSLYQLQLQRDLVNNKKVLRYVVVKSNKVKALEFTKTGTEEIQIDNKRYKTVRLQRVNQDDNKETDIWVIPELQHQIARIVHKAENGESYEINLTKFSARNEALRDFYIDQKTN